MFIIAVILLVATSGLAVQLIQEQCSVLESMPFTETNKAPALLAESPLQRQLYQALFSDWLKRHKVLIHSNDHYIQRLEVFVDNDKFIRATNKQALSYKLGHNLFSHLTLDEWRHFVHLGLTTPHPTADKHRIEYTDPQIPLPKEIDWVAKVNQHNQSQLPFYLIYCTNQGSCHDCQESRPMRILLELQHSRSS